jgi:hypothetical protein
MSRISVNKSVQMSELIMSAGRNDFVTNFYHLTKENFVVVLYEFVHTLHVSNVTDSEEEVKPAAVTSLI